ncbi:MAG: multiheme c-type cytochrome [Pirellulales bacterium]
MSAIPAGAAGAASTGAPKVKRAVSPRMRIVLVVVLTLFSLLAANGVYLFAITWLEHLTGEVYQDYFYQLMFLVHLALGFIIIAPVLIFGFVHMWASKNRRNKRAIRIGYALFIISIVVLVSGVLLTRAFGFELKQPAMRTLIYWAHVICPLVAVWLYWLHRLVGPRIKWYVGARIGITLLVLVIAMIVLQMQDPRAWNVAGPKEGEKYFQPSLARTSTGNFIPPESLMNDEYCMKCHKDIYNNWLHSAHHFSSFNNPAYLYAIRETRKVVSERDGSVQASRWCAGCHDPVPFFSGAFDQPNYDDVKDPTSQAGITCTACHAITNVGGDPHDKRYVGNGNYVIEEPIQYPFTFSKSPILQSVNELLVKAKPTFHKQTFLKPFHKTAEFCSTCHKVHLPKDVTNYKDFVRGQNHYDPYLLSGVSGHGAQSFYYPPIAQTNCNGCHMPQVASDDFGARFNGELGKMAVHDHFFPGANTALPFWRGEDDYVEKAAQLLKGTTRVDIFGIREGGMIEGELKAPLAEKLPALKAGDRYLIETVIRTLKLGHPLTQGTVDSNELWVDITVKCGDRVIGRSGGMDDKNEVDPWSHFINVFMLDRKGNRIARRNAQDIFVPLYNHQIPPGAGQTIHYGLSVPEWAEQPIEIIAELKYRKFDKGYLDFMHSSVKPGDNAFRGQGPSGTTPNPLPVTVMSKDRVVLPIIKKDGTLVAVDPAINKDRKVPAEWERWNDYGIGMLLAGNSQLLQAGEAFKQVEKLGRWDGPVNLGRVLFAEGDLDGATEALLRAGNMDPPPPEWTAAWLSGEINRQQGYLKEAADNFRKVLYDDTQERRNRKFDFSLDFRVRNQLGLTLLDLAEQSAARGDKADADAYLKQAENEVLQVLKTDSEDLTAHASLAVIYRLLGDKEKAQHHHELHLKYKPDDNAIDVARPIARRQYPAANHAAEQLVVYSLHRIGAYALPAESQLADPQPESTGPGDKAAQQSPADSKSAEATSVPAPVPVTSDLKPQSTSTLVSAEQ